MPTWPRSATAIDTPAGGQVPLGDVADVFIGPAPNEIKPRTRRGGSM